MDVTEEQRTCVACRAQHPGLFEVEERLYQHPDMAECAVIGVPDERWGETVKALVVLREGAAATGADLIEHCRDGMAHYKCPTSVEMVTSLPRTATGKLQKFRLREPFWQSQRPGEAQESS